MTVTAAPGWVACALQVRYHRGTFPPSPLKSSYSLLSRPDQARTHGRQCTWAAGEPVSRPGTTASVVQEVVYDAGVLFVASAGNNGPGLTTVGAPGGTSSAIMSIGAYVSPSSAATVHSHPITALPEGWEGQQYNWSSRGAQLLPSIPATIARSLQLRPHCGCQANFWIHTHRPRVVRKHVSCLEAS